MDTLHEIVRRLVHAGGSPLLVGGCVRDRILGVESKDIDIEVYGLPLNEIVRAFEGLRLDVVGASFAVIKVHFDGQSYDVSIPRRENKIGVGYEGFEVHPDPLMTPLEAAARRDFTMNSLASTVDGVLLDYYGGERDIKAGLLRATSTQFSEDPLRVLRGMQFAARFKMKLEEQTAALCKAVAHEYSALPRERVWTEFEKLFLKGQHISYGIQVLVDSGWLLLFPELHAMHACPQDPEWHPEGDVLTHVKHVTDEAAAIADREGLRDADRLILVVSALLHDVGKPATTVKNDFGRWTSPGHDEAGVEPAQSFLRSIGAPGLLFQHVPNLVREHMAHLAIPDPSPRVVRRLTNRCWPATLQMWSYLVEADHSGRPPLPKANPARRYVEIGRELDILADKPVPILLGRHLIEHFQFPCGPPMGVLLKAAYEEQIEVGWTRLDQALEWARAQIAV